MQQITVETHHWPDLDRVRYIVHFPLQKRVITQQTNHLPKSLAIAARNSILNKLINETLKRFFNQRKHAITRMDPHFAHQRYLLLESLTRLEAARDKAMKAGLSHWQNNIVRLEPDLLFLLPTKSTSRQYSWVKIIKNIISILKP